MTTPEDANTVAGGSPVERGVGRLEPERDAVAERRARHDAMLADDDYYQPQIAKTPLPKPHVASCGCRACDVRRNQGVLPMRRLW